MTRCPTCHIRKPDSLFTTIKHDEGKCLNCRQTGRKLVPRGHDDGCATEKAHDCDCLRGRKIRTTQAAQIKPTKEDEKILRLARKEMRGFRRRGSPQIDRPYAYIGGSSEKGMIARGPFKREGG